MDTRSFDKYNVVYLSQSSNCGESMPLGGSGIGANVWVENDILKIYFQQNGGYDENGRLLKQGRLSVSFPKGTFQDGFRQELHLRDGYISICGSGCNNKVNVQIWIDHKKPIIQIITNYYEKNCLDVSYENWRFVDKIVEPFDYELFGAKEVWGYVGEKGITFHKDDFIVKNDCILFYHKNDNDDLSFDKEMDAQGLSEEKNVFHNPQKNLITGGKLCFGNQADYVGTYSGNYLSTPFVAHKYRLAPAKKHVINVILHTGQYSDIIKWKDSIPDASDSCHEQTIKSWNQFWESSYILINKHLNSEDTLWRIGRNYNLWRYISAANKGSKFPDKFNGGLFTYDPEIAIKDSRHNFHHIGHSKESSREKKYQYSPDYRRWGGATYTLQNQRLLYWPLLKCGDYEVMKQFFNFYKNLLPTAKLRTKKMFGNDGAIFPEQISAYGLCPTCDSGWNNTSGLPVPQIRYLFSNALEMAFMITEYERFTGSDISDYLDLIFNVIIIYDEFYGENDCNGKMIIYPANALESYHPVKNPVDAIAGLMSLIPRVVNKYEGKQREKIEALYNRLPVIPLTNEFGCTTISYAESISERHNVELPQLYPVFPYSIFGLHRSETIDVARNTALYAPESDDQLDVISWLNVGVQYSRLGMKNEAIEYLIRKGDDGGRRFPAFFGPGWDWTPDLNHLGSFAIQLQEMLLQTVDDYIRITPCLPSGIDVDFKLFAPKERSVECSIVDSKICKLEILPSVESNLVIVDI